MSPDDLLLAMGNPAPTSPPNYRLGVVTAVVGGRIDTLVGNSVVNGIPYAEGMTPFVGCKVWLLMQGSVVLCFGMPAEQDPSPSVVVNYFPAQWSASYSGAGALRSGVAACYQGYLSATLGNQASLAGFDVAALAAAVAGRTVTGFDLIVSAAWYSPTGGTLVIGTHANTSRPGTLGSVTDDLQRQAWTTKTGQRVISLNSGIRSALIAGTAKGLAFGPGPTTDTDDYYGYLYGVGMGNEPLLRVTSV
jgi:hypothetical protein